MIKQTTVEGCKILVADMPGGFTKILFENGEQVILAPLEKSTTKDSVFSGVFGMGYYHELPVAIENPKGSIRSGARQGEFWSAKMPADYGYVRCTRGADDMQVDCFVGPDPASNLVLVIDQKDLDTGAFDEHKCMLGFTTAEQARACYVAAYHDGYAAERIMNATVCSMEDFKKWLVSGDLKRPYRGQ